ncbi:hypothetical protein FHS42_003622 [Streptomyces zagrosensis]|uniref:Uncharacterized protein n=1 Tax=Streptomyces zagrosensis TaxID=1042984 RepID=A0A7W9QCM3_9ACTN|nr:hypothetical protein [Streptomyces zagrosensis]
MLVHRVLSPTTRLESWTVLGDDDVPVGPIEQYLAYLTDIERPPNTIQGVRPRPQGLLHVPGTARGLPQTPHLSASAVLTVTSAASATSADRGSSA